mgnify:FL=1
MSAYVAYAECASQLIDIDLLSCRAEKINRHNQRYDRTCNTYKPIRQIVEHIQCNVRNNIRHEQSHYSPEERGHQRYSVFIGYPEHTVIPELLTEHSFHKPAREVFKRRAGNKSHKENLKSVISERMTDKQKE